MSSSAAQPVVQSPSSASLAPALRRVDALRASWLVRLRWGALLGQLASIGLAAREHHELPILWLSLLVASTALSNLWLAARDSGLVGWRTGAVLVVDVLVFAALLALSGGPANPFSVFFLVYVALAALLLRGRWAWLLLALTVVAFGSLFVLDPEAAGLLVLPVTRPERSAVVR